MNAELMVNVHLQGGGGGRGEGRGQPCHFLIPLRSLFWKGYVAQGRKHEVAKVVSLCKNNGKT